MPPEVERAAPAPQSRRASAMLVLLLCATFVASLSLYTRANRQPYTYHPDEPEKAAQVYRNYRNFRHPQLLLAVTECATALADTPRAPQQTVVVGRFVAALFAALAVTTLAMLGYVIGGTGGLVASAALVGLCPFLLVNAHYMKEDTALILGMSMTALSATRWPLAASRGQRFCSAGLLGFSCAVAASAKYVGALALPPTIALLLIYRPDDKRELLRCLGVLILAFAVETLAINSRMLFSLGTFANSMRWHGVTPVTGHAGLQLAWPSMYYPRTVHVLAGVQVELLALAGALMIVFVRRRRAKEMIPVAVAVLCFAPLLLCRSNFPRYALPAVVFITFLGALGIVMAVRAVPPHWRTAATAGAVVLCAGIQMRPILRCVDQLGDDSRDRLIAWMTNHLPPGSRVAADTYAGPFVTFGGQQVLEVKPGVRVHAALFAADIAPVDRLRAAGYTHVAVSAAAFGRYFDPDLSPLPDHIEIYRQRREWYNRLFAEQALIWSSDPSPDLMGYTNPPLRLYRLSENVTSSPAEAGGADPRSSRAAH